MAQQMANPQDEWQGQDDHHDGRAYHSNVEFDSDSKVKSDSKVTLLLQVLAAQHGLSQVAPLAKADLFERYKHACYTYLRKLGVDQDAAETLLTEIKLKLFEGKLLGTFDPSRGFRKYLKQVLRNQTWDYLQKIRRNREALGNVVSLDTLDGNRLTELGVPGEQTDAQIEFDRSHAHTVLSIAIDNTKVKEATSKPEKGNTVPFDVDILIWMKCDGRTAPEIAEETRLTKNAVRARARAARLRLREAIREHLREEGMTEDQIDDEIRDLLDSFGT